MSGSGFAPAVAAFTAALGDRLAPGVASFQDLFTDDAVIDVPFDGDGSAAPTVGRAAIAAMVASLEGFLRFESATISAVHDTTTLRTVVVEYEAVLHRADHPGALRRRYVSVVHLRAGRIAHLREHGGPFMPAES